MLVLLVSCLQSKKFDETVDGSTMKTMPKRCYHNSVGRMEWDLRSWQQGEGTGSVALSVTYFDGRILILAKILRAL